MNENTRGGGGWQMRESGNDLVKNSWPRYMLKSPDPSSLENPHHVALFDFQFSLKSPPHCLPWFLHHHPLPHLKCESEGTLLPTPTSRHFRYVVILCSLATSDSHMCTLSTCVYIFNTCRSHTYALNIPRTPPTRLIRAGQMPCTLLMHVSSTFSFFYIVLY
jgi:hypothetical protein